MNKAVNAIFGLAALLVLYVLAQILLFATFKIPSDSMEPTLIEGDVISVCKPALGARIFNIWTALKGEEVDVYRLSAFLRSEGMISWFLIFLIRSGINGMRI